MNRKRLRVLLVPDSIYWATGTIAKYVAAANPWIEATILSGPLLPQFFKSGEDIAERFDLVHFTCPYVSRDWLPQLRALLPVVTSHHHVTSWDIIRHNIDGDAIVACSSEWVRDLESRGADMSRVFRVPYGIDTDVFIPQTAAARERSQSRLGLRGAEPVVGFFAKRSSNDDDRKGTDVFIEAVRLLQARLPEAGVLIVGPGWHDLVDTFRREGIRCAWVPFARDEEELAALFHALDFYWVTSRVEGAPVTLLEGMSSGICCLSTPVGLASDILRDGENGFLLPMNDAGAFASKTAGLAGKDAERAAVSLEGRATMVLSMKFRETQRHVFSVYERAVEVFAERNPQVRVTPVPEPVALQSDTPVDVPLAALDQAERRRAQMLEVLAWSETLISYQNQKGEAIRLIAGTWARNPLSLQPLRALLRQLLPRPITQGIVRIKRLLLPAA